MVVDMGRKVKRLRIAHVPLRLQLDSGFAIVYSRVLIEKRDAGTGPEYHGEGGDLVRWTYLTLADIFWDSVSD